MHRIPSLDGLRALSIAAVFLGHLDRTEGFPAWVTPILARRYLDIAHLGVRVFFVISGFLITGLLLREVQATGRVSLVRFYLRRTLRILPAYAVFLAAVAILVAAGVLDETLRAFAHALTYTTNYAGRRSSWNLGHLWSLAVEEQFYLLWPITFSLAGRRKASVVALVVVLIVPFIRLWAVIQDSGLSTSPPVGYTFETACDTLAIGCVLALWRDRLETQAMYRRVIGFWWLAPGLLAVSVLLGLDHHRIALLFRESFANVAAAVLIAQCVRFPTTLVGRLLNSRPLVYVGVLSYSLYLWQQLFFHRGNTGWPNRFPVSLVLAILCALASYYCVERPFLAMRPRAERWLLARKERRAAAMLLAAGAESP